jgi:hypothetical protein
MKRLWIGIIILYLNPSFTHAQLINSAGCKTGISLANQSFDYSSSYEPDLRTRIGFDFAICTEWLDMPSFHIITEIHYIQRGMIQEIEGIRDENNVLLPAVKVNNRVDYLSIPILAKLILKRKLVSPYTFIGPRFDFLLGYKAGTYPSQGGTLGGLYDQFKSSSFSGDIGLGAEVNITDLITTLVEFRYSPDFTYSYKTEFLKVKNRSYEILVGCLIPLSIK